MDMTMRRGHEEGMWICKQNEGSRDREKSTCGSVGVINHQSLLLPFPGLVLLPVRRALADLS